jgi:hypothetical protein
MRDNKSHRQIIPPPRVTQDEWGVSLVIRDGGYTYDIEWRRVATLPAYLKWMNQLAEKTWVTAEQLNQFTQLVFQHNGWDSRA